MRLSIAFGVYDLQWIPAYPMTPAIMRTTLENALRRTDRYVWYFTEGDDWWGGANKPPADYVQAIRDARAAAGLMNP